MPNPHWTKEELEQVATMDSYEDMLALAMQILPRIPEPVVQVCGPISTGGMGSVADNFRIFDMAIELLIAGRENVFDQRPFEHAVQNIKRKGVETGYLMGLLDDFFLPIFETGYIAKFYFLPGWETSKGASWEYEQAKRLGIASVMPHDWMEAQGL
ncbi:MAG: hypothetical protein WD850_03145 [Candidatus Spechtbacterales bacterium]